MKASYFYSGLYQNKNCKALIFLLLLGFNAKAQQTAALPQVKIVTAPSPPEDVVDSRWLGKLHFKDGYPSKETVDRLYDELDYQRGTQAFLRNFPALSMYGLRVGLSRDLGVDAANKLAIFQATASSLMLTPNAETIYATTFLRLDTDGPTVIEAPAKVLGLVNDMWMRPVEDIGPSGPDKGNGGKYLFVPPGYKGTLPASGYFIVQMNTYGGWLLLRAFLDPSGNATGANALLKQVKIYPLSKKGTPPAMVYIDANGKPFNSTPPNDLRAFEELADLISKEYEQAIDAETLGTLSAVGITKGKVFSPDERMKTILKEAAQTGSFMAQCISYAPRNSEPLRDGSKWMAGIAGYPTFNDGTRTLLNEMVYMTWFATGAAKAMVAPKVGTGSQYAWTFYDTKGQWLLGEKSYKFRIPPNPPAKDFWSILAYDNWTRSILPNGQKVAGKNSYDKNIQSNADGSIDIYFGPTAPKGKEKNWIQTVPGKGWFAIFRLYGPLEPWFNKTWIPDNIAELN